MRLRRACEELTLRAIPFKRQLTFPVNYKGIRIECDYRIDLVIDAGAFSSNSKRSSNYCRFTKPRSSHIYALQSYPWACSSTSTLQH